MHLAAAPSFTLTDWRCENLVNPCAIDGTQPHFSWKIQTTEPIQQRYYEIQVASDEAKLVDGQADLWKSGKMRSAESVMVPYIGKPLASRALCYWRVRVWPDRGEASAWSPVQRFAVGILADDALRGQYIGLAAGNGDVRAPLLRKSFTIGQPVTTFLHVNSLGYHEVYINGTKVGRDVLAPAVSQLGVRSLINTYDVTSYLRPGRNELVLWLGQGWYKQTTFGAQYDGPLVKAELDVLCGGQWDCLFATDATWAGRESGYSDTGTWQALRFGGERIDARLLPVGLSAAELDKLAWYPVTAVSVPAHKVSPQMCEPNVMQQTFTPKSITRLAENTWLVDMGKVLTGWFELSVPQLPAGQEITVTYTDDLKLDPDFKEQGEKDVYIASGHAGDRFCNKFNHHAFRYIRIENLPQQPDASQIKAYLVHGDYRRTSTFQCSDPDLNAIHNMVQYTMSCLTFGGYMVDCPHLERAGYGGDGNSSTQALQTMYDVSPTFMNWLQTWSDSMREGGSLPHVGPNPGAGGGGPYWCGFFVMAPWRTYVNYNDPRLIERYYEGMKQWLGYVDQYTVDGLLKRWPDLKYRDWYLGDWLAPDGVDSGNQASIDLVNNCFISECLSALNSIALYLGRPEEAQRYATRKAALNKLLHETYYHPQEQIYATGSQLDMCYPMLVGVVPEALYPEVKAQMMARTASQHKGHIAVGLVGVPILTEWTIRNQAADFMYALLKQPDYPGYLHMINNGATTTWEYWNGERSRVHNCYNGIGTWFYQAVGGLRPDADKPGYRHVYIDPQVPQGITWAKTTKESPYGTIRVDWELKDGRMIMDITLPVGVEASVVTPRNAVGCTMNNKSIDPRKTHLPLRTGTHHVEFICQQQ